MGSQIAEVLLVELAQGRDQGFGALHGATGKGVRFVFVLTGETTGKRAKPKSHKAAEERDKEEDRDAALHQSRVQIAGADKPVGMGQPTEGCKHDKGTDRGKQDHLGNVTEFVMTDFMSENRLNFFGIHLLDKGIEKDDAAEAPESGKDSIGVTGAFAAVHHKNGLCLESGAIGERKESGLQVAFLEWFEFIKQWHDKHGISHHHDQLEEKEDAITP